MDCSEVLPCPRAIKYENDYWNPISKAVDKILCNNNSTLVSFERMYSIVYKCVCDGYAERLHADLIAQCASHLEDVDQTLSINASYMDPMQFAGAESARLVMDFHEVLERYMIAIQHITPIFAYLNKFYVEVTLSTSLQTEVLELFRLKVADRRIDSLIASIEVLLAQPFALAPSAASALFTNLHRVGRGEYARRYPYLFARYIANVLPPMERSDIDSHIREVAELQVQLRMQQGWQGPVNDQSKKRRGDEDNYGPPAPAPSVQVNLMK